MNANVVEEPGIPPPLGAQIVPLSDAANDDGPLALSPADRVAEAIGKQWHAATGVDLVPDRRKIARILQGVFWSGRASKLYLLNARGDLCQFTDRRSPGALLDRFGPLANIEKMKAAVNAANDNRKGKPVTVADLHKLAGAAIVDGASYANQRETVAWFEDLWADRNHIELVDDVARVVLAYRPIEQAGIRNDALAADYQQHFPELDDFLCMLVAARFARDRRRAYLWLHATSGWGKGLLSSVLQVSGLVVETSEREIARAMRGEPVGLVPEAFKRSAVLLVNEFSTVSGEIKQLERELRLSPKNQLQSRVPLYLKLFTSAESVESLVTDSGVEDQFAERVSYLGTQGRLDDRPAFKRDPGAYFDAVLFHVTRRLYELMHEMFAMGRHDAELTAQMTLDHYHDLWGIGKRFGTLTEGMEEIAREFRDWVDASLSGTHARYTRAELFEEFGNGRVWMRNAPKVLDDYITTARAKSQQRAVRLRRDDILAAVSRDGKGHRRRKYDGGSARRLLWEGSPNE